jgi:ribosomal protein S12 methylthiotransferase accessory factor
MRLCDKEHSILLGKIRGMESCLNRAPALFCYPVLYDQCIISQEDHSKKVKDMLSCSIIARFGKGFKFTDEPKFEMYFAQHNLNVNENLHGSSVDFDRERAKIKALGECFERFSLVCNEKSQSLTGSYSELTYLKENAMDPVECLNFSDQHLPVTKEEYAELLRNAKIRWLVGNDIAKNKSIFLPYQLVFLPTFEELGTEPLIRIPITTGTACGDSFEEAALRGILECIERDSNMLCWLGKRNVPRIILDIHFFEELEKYLKRYNIKLYTWDLTSDLGIPSVLAITIDKTGTGPAVSAGTKADLDPKKAVLGAIYEAFHSRFWIRSLYHTEGRPKIEKEDITDLSSRGFYWYNQDKIKHLKFLMKSEKQIRLSEMKNLTPKNKTLGSLVNLLSEKHVDVYLVDITHPRISEKGFFVVRSILPQLHPMHLDENMPYHYSRRLEKINKDEVNKVPAPFL